jgi:hypothetical protein
MGTRLYQHCADDSSDDQSAGKPEREPASERSNHSRDEQPNDLPGLCTECDPNAYFACATTNGKRDDCV